MISGMMLRRLVQVCLEELRKAKRGAISAYGMMREADERALKMLLMFLGIG